MTSSSLCATNCFNGTKTSCRIQEKHRQSSSFQRAAVFLLEKEEALARMEREAGVRNQADERVDERDEFAALEEAAPDLIRLDRYERRAWSRQKRAIGDFMNMKLMRAIHAPRRPLQG
jgi:hypothetical protein